MIFPWSGQLTGGPDAARYIALSEGKTVARPFHLRWALPALCGQSCKAWWAVWLTSWPVLAGGMVGWRFAAGDRWPQAVAATILLLALPGILGPKAVIPVGVDLPATALTLCGVALFTLGDPMQQVAGLIVIGWASTIRETCPIWAALWLWNPVPLLLLTIPAARHWHTKPGPDPLGERFDLIAAHPIQAALQAHAGRWRDGWVMVAPWGACLAALYHPSWPLAVVLAAAYLQLLIATDTVRLLHHAAGPVMAAAAAHNIPTVWLAAVCAAHVVWWKPPERV